MAEDFLSLTKEEQREALGVAAQKAKRPVALLEKDIWVVWAVDALFSSVFSHHLVFKGGTSLSKGYNIINRFSEDVDITYDIRQLIPDLMQGRMLPENGSQEKKWTKAVRERLPAWVKEKIAPMLQEHAEKTGARVEINPDGERIFIEYETVSEGRDDYVSPRVMLEFGARSTGEPSEDVTVSCDAASFLPELIFPKAKPRVMLPRRTFWEKATAVHVYCKGGKVRDRYSRHWYDLARLGETRHAQEAIDDADLAKQVAEHKSWFFSEKDRDGHEIDYITAVSGSLCLVPTDKAALDALRDDYTRMREAGLFSEEPESFDELMDKCKVLEVRANGK